MTTDNNPDFYYDPILGLQYHFVEDLFMFNISWVTHMPVEEVFKLYNRSGVILQNSLK